MIGKPKFYKAGLKFECTSCGNCCRLKGGKVSVSEVEIKNIGLFLGMSPENFKEKYCLAGPATEHLIDQADGACIFLDEDRCRIYLVRPLQCRTFPFWPENLKSRVRWKQLKSYCPGIDQGPLHPASWIEAQMRAQKKADK